MTPIRIFQRKNIWYLRKAVPRRFANVVPNKMVWISLHTDSKTEAMEKAMGAWRDLLASWEARLKGDTSNAEQRFDAAKDLAARRGFSYLPAQAVAALPLAERLERVQAIPVRHGSPDKIEAAALLGGAPEPGITIERALELFFENESDKTRGKSEDQIRRWKNPRKRAFKNLVGLIGNKQIADLTRTDFLEFRKYWQNRMESENLVADSANKDLIHVSFILRTVNERLQLGLNLPTEKLTFADDKGEERDRPPFSDKWIRETILAPGALDGLNKEARCILLALINTGARPSEIAGLLPEHIHLSGPVPHISIEADGKQLKTKQSKRKIPLVGVSLAAFKECPEGFITYRFKDRISDTLNKFMRENGLMESDRHVLYSLRHSFQDRMIAGEFDDRLRRQLFGHKLIGEVYGKGPTLEHAHRKMQEMAI